MEKNPDPPKCRRDNLLQKEWYFFVVDVTGILTDGVDPADYLKKCARGIITWGQIVPQVAMRTVNGKIRKTLKIFMENAENFQRLLSDVMEDIATIPDQNVSKT